MNTENLHELIRRYEEQYEMLNDGKNNELFKWEAVRCFQNVWLLPEKDTASFASFFAKATRKSSVLLDGSTITPANGIVKMAEKEETEVKRLFEEVLFADDGGDLDIRQKNMEDFLDSIEKIRLKYYPAYWKYKQDRHAASCYLALRYPEQNYIYKYSHVERFATYIEFGKDIGSGSTFNLGNYYEMCDLIVAALLEHESLLEMYEKRLKAKHYADQSLHLMAFDLIYCASTYRLFYGLQSKTKAESIEAYRMEEIEKAREAEKQAKITALEEAIQELEVDLDAYRELDLVGTEVYHKQYGKGTVISQKDCCVQVSFGDLEKGFEINRKYIHRPKFEDDAQIVDAFTAFSAKLVELKTFQQQLNLLLKN